MLIGVCGGVVSGSPTGGAEFVAVTSGTWPRVGVGLLPTEFVCTEAKVAIEDCEFDLAGLPGRTENIGAGEGCEGGGTTGVAFAKAGETFANEGDTVAVGVGTGVLLEDDGAGADAGEIEGWCRVGCGPA